MKRLLTLLFAIPLIGTAQTDSSKINVGKFTLTVNGFRSESDSSKDYIVVEVPGVNKADLYKKALLAINSTFVSAKDVVSTVEGESISINWKAPNSIRRTNAHVFDLNSTVVFLFKDGKVRVNAPSINSISTYTAGAGAQRMYPGTGNGDMFGQSFYIYKKNGELRQDKAKEDLEKTENTLIERIFLKFTSSKDSNW